MTMMMTMVVVVVVPPPPTTTAMMIAPALTPYRPGPRASYSTSAPLLKATPESESDVNAPRSAASARALSSSSFRPEAAPATSTKPCALKSFR